MTDHCEACSEPLTQAPDGTWLHARNPDTVEAALCVTVIDHGVPRASSYYPLQGEPCTNPDCDWELELPWWEETP